MALQNAGATPGASMATTSFAAGLFRFGTTNSPLCCCSPASASLSLSASAQTSYPRGKLLRRRRSPLGCNPTGTIQPSGETGLILGGVGILRDLGRVGRTEEAENTKVVLSRAFGGRDGDPVFLVGEDYNSVGPIELPSREIDPFAIPDASPAQIVASILLTGAIAVLSYRALRKRAARSKAMQFRSSGISSTRIKEDARKTVLENLTTKAPEVPTPPQSPLQTLFGAVVAGVIALGLYKFTSTVEAGFNVKAVSQDYSIRNLTITIRTIITGLCYLATFVFAANSIGLTLYAFQLLLGIGVTENAEPRDSLPEESKTEEKVEAEDLLDK